MSSGVASLLVPRPQRLDATGMLFELPPSVVLEASSDGAARVGARVERALGALGVKAHFEGRSSELATDALFSERPEHRRFAISLAIETARFGQRESYHLRVDSTGIELLAADEAGLFHGVSTLLQLCRLGADKTRIVLPALVIRDWPDFAQRGVMLDISRDKVPRLGTLFALVDMLAGWKINQLQLYVEHTFAYRNHEAVWKNASPLTARDIALLDGYCRERHVELVPNQNSFGHLERWLQHPPYRHLAECPDGFVLPRSSSAKRAPQSLCPVDPDSIVFLSRLYDELLPLFTSQKLNVGLDETWELGLGRSAAACEERGAARVYLEFLQKVHRLASERGKTMMFWGDIIMHQPELIAELPRDVVALEWGYEADHPFVEHLSRFAAEGLAFYVCPGTSSWNSIAGRTRNALGNIAGAARAGREAGAVGYLVTDWGDNGHLQPLPVSYLGLLAGASASWNAADECSQEEVAARLSAHAFGDRAGVMGSVACELGNAYLELEAPRPNGTALFWLLLRADQPMPGDLTAASLERALAFVDRTMSGMARARMEIADRELVQEEYEWVADTLRLACRLGLSRLATGGAAPVAAIAPAERQKLAGSLRELARRHRELWALRNRPGGLDDSAARLEALLFQLETK